MEVSIGQYFCVGEALVFVSRGYTSGSRAEEIYSEILESAAMYRPLEISIPVNIPSIARQVTFTILSCIQNTSFYMLAYFVLCELPYLSFRTVFLRTFGIIIFRRPVMS